MKRRQAIQTLATAAAALPLLRVPLEADELTADQAFVLRDVAGTVLPSAIGRKGQDEAVDNFLRWIRDYKEGVPLSHGYGEPRLVKSGPSPAPGYAKQIAALQAAAKAKGGRFGALPLVDRRALLDEAFKSRRCSEPSRPARRQTRGGRSHGALLPQQRRQRSLLQRAHRAQHVSRHSRHHRASRAPHVPAGR